MKTRCIFILALVTSLMAKAQLTELPIIIKGKEIVYADKKLVYAFDSKAFYIYEDTAIFRFWPQRYKCDTIEWGTEYDSPVKYYQYESPYFCQFSDKLNGIIIRRKRSENRKCVTLKTSDGGKHWSLLHELPDSVGFSSQVAFHNFDNYIINDYSSTCVYRNGQFFKPQLDSLNRSLSVLYGSGSFVASSIYDSYTRVSYDEGLTWDTYKFPLDTGIWRVRILENQQIVNGKVLLFHKPSPYAPFELTKWSTLTVLDLKTKQWIQQKQSGAFDYTLMDRKGNLYFSKRTYYPPSYANPDLIDYTLHLHTKDTTIVTSRLRKIPNSIRSFRGASWQLVQIRDSTLYLFDHPDCDNIDMKNATLEGESLAVEMKAREIDPIAYPRLMVLDALNGDTLSNLCCLYQLGSNGTSSLESKLLKVPSSDSILVLLTQINGNRSLCVAKTTFETTQNPLSLPTNGSNETVLHVFPNPSTDFIQISNVSQSFDMKLVNDVGQVIMQKTHLAPLERIDIRHLDTGHYSLMITFDKDTSQRFSFLKR